MSNSMINYFQIKIHITLNIMNYAINYAAMAWILKYVKNCKFWMTFCYKYYKLQANYTFMKNIILHDH